MNRRNVFIGLGSALAVGGAGALGWRSAVGSARDYGDRAARLRAPLPADPGMHDLVRYATLAANSHNTQPWRFRAEEDGIEILPDPSRATPVVDPDDHHLFISLGCAAENLAIAAAATGRPGEVAARPDGSVRYGFVEGAAQPDPLFDAIPRRQSTRALYDGRPVPAADVERLRRAAQVPGVRLVLVTERAEIDRVRDLVVAGNDAQMADPAFRTELKQWLRFNPRSAAASGDGLFSAASGNPTIPDFLGDLAFDLFVTPAAESEKVARQIDSSAGIAILLAEREDREHWVAVGRAMQRLALEATALGLKHAYVNQPVEVARLRPDLAALIGENGRRPDLVIRFGYGPEMPFSLRRPVEAVLA